MKATYVKDPHQGPVNIATLPMAGDAEDPQIGDIVTVYGEDGATEFNVRLLGAAPPDAWQGVIFSIMRSGEPLNIADGVEVEDMVQVTRQEIASIIHCENSH